MCNHCYHAKGRTKLATMCRHLDRRAYAKGLCMSCYQMRQCKLRKQRKQMQ